MSDDPKSFSWRFGQTYKHLLLVHWPVPIDRLKRLVPAPLEIATFEGKAWIGHDVYIGTEPRVFDLPPIPDAFPRPIVTLRTIVDVAGARGIFLLSLDAPMPLATLVEHDFLHVRSSEADVQITERGDEINVVSTRAHGVPARLSAQYRPTGPVRAPRPGSQDEFLLGGNRMFTTDGTGGVQAIDVSHGPWSLAPAEVTFDLDTIAAAVDLPGPERRMMGVYQRTQDAYAAMPKTIV